MFQITREPLHIFPSACRAHIEIDTGCIHKDTASMATFSVFFYLSFLWAIGNNGLVCIGPLGDKAMEQGISVAYQ